MTEKRSNEPDPDPDPEPCADALGIEARSRLRYEQGRGEELHEVRALAEQRRGQLIELSGAALERDAALARLGAVRGALKSWLHGVDCPAGEHADCNPAEDSGKGCNHGNTADECRACKGLCECGVSRLWALVNDEPASDARTLGEARATVARLRCDVAFWQRRTQEARARAAPTHVGGAGWVAALPPDSERSDASVVPWWDMVDEISPNRGDSLFSWVQHGLLAHAVKRGGAVATANREGRTDAFDPIVDALVSSGGRVVKASALPASRALGIDDDREGRHAWLIGPHAAARVDWMPSNDSGAGFAQVEVMALGAALADRIMAAVTIDLMRPEPKQISRANARPVYMLSAEMGGAMPVHAGSVSDELAEGNYTPEVLRAVAMAGAAIASTRPRGRLTIITGPTGTGKTHLLRGLIARSPEALYVMIDPEIIAELTKPTLVPMLTRLRESEGVKPIVFVVEDGDRAVAERQADNLSLVQPLLNLGGGLAGDLFNVHVVLTTNARIGRELKIDKAFARKGRLAALVETDLLTPDHAASVYARLLPGREPAPPFEQATSLADVYARALDDGWEDTSAPPAPPPRVRRAQLRAIHAGPDPVF